MREKEKVDYVQIALLSVGLSVLWPYFRLSFMTFVQGYAACSNDDVQYLFTSFVVALLMMVVLASVLHRKASQILAKPVTSLALAAIGAIGLVLLWLPLEGVAGLVVFCVGSCLCAVFFAGSVLAYGCVLFRMSLRQASLCCFLGFALCFFSNLAYLLPALGRAVFSAALPLVSGACLFLAQKRCGTVAEGVSWHEAEKADAAVRLPVGFVILLAVFCMVGNLVRGATNPWYASAVASDSVFYMSVVNVLVSMTVVAVLAEAKSTSKVLYWLWTLSTICFFVGLVAVAFLPAGFAPFGSDAMTVSRVYFTVLMFVSALILARTYRSTPVFLVSLCLLLPEGLSMLVRYVALPVLDVFAGVSVVEGMAQIGTVAMLVSVLAMCLTLNRLLLGQSVRESEGADALPDPSQNLDVLADRFGLTPREKEVASWLARGYSLDATAKKLNVSINTVRTHARVLYRKLGVHNRQSFVDLLDEQHERH